MPLHQRSTLLDDLSQDVLALNLDLSPEQLGQLIDYVALLTRWNLVYNLTAIRDPVMMITQHLADCLAVIPAIESRHGAQRALELFDVGCGAGLPLVVLGIARPQWRLVGYDTVAKKVAFVQQTVAQLGLRNLAVHHQRVENLEDELADLVICRAFSSLAQFIRVAGHLCRAPGELVAMKGAISPAELSEIPDTWRVTEVQELRVPRLDAQRHLVWLQPAGIAQWRR